MLLSINACDIAVLDRDIPGPSGDESEHALGDKLYDGGRWIAAAAIRLGSPLVSHDGVFKSAPRLQLVTATELRAIADFRDNLCSGFLSCVERSPVVRRYRSLARSSRPTRSDVGFGGASRGKRSVIRSR